MPIDYQKRLHEIAKQRERVRNAEQDLEDAKEAQKAAKEQLSLEQSNLDAMLDEDPDQTDLFDAGQ